MRQFGRPRSWVPSKGVGQARGGYQDVRDHNNQPHGSSIRHLAVPSLGHLCAQRFLRDQLITRLHEAEVPVRVARP